MTYLTCFTLMNMLCARPNTYRLKKCKDGKSQLSGEGGHTSFFARWLNLTLPPPTSHLVVRKEPLWNGARITAPQEAASTLGTGFTVNPTERNQRTQLTGGQAGTGWYASRNKGALRTGFFRPGAPYARNPHVTAADATRAGWGRDGPARPKWTGKYRTR